LKRSLNAKANGSQISPYLASKVGLKVKPVRRQPKTTGKGQERSDPEDATQLAMQAFQAKPEAYRDKQRSYHQPDHTMGFIGHWPTTAREIDAGEARLPNASR